MDFFRNQPNAQATAQILTKKALLDDLVTAIGNAFTLATAVGAQLDIIGQYVGVSRYQANGATVPYFGFWDASGVVAPNNNGFRDADNPTTTNASAVFFNAQASPTQLVALSDSSYRFLIQLKIVLNHCDGTLYSIQNYLHTFFNGIISVVDNQNMSLTYTVRSSAPLSASILTAFLPKPMGVAIVVNLIP